MEEFINFKKWGIILLILIGAGWYVRTHYDLQDILRVAREHPDPEKSPKAAYYVGSIYYFQTRYEEAAGAYTQLLTGYPTSRYAPKALMRLGRIRKNQRKYPEAREAYSIYLKYFPDASDFEKVGKAYEVIKFERGEEVTDGLMQIYGELEHPANEVSEF